MATLIELIMTSNVTTNVLLTVIVVTNFSMRHNVERALASQGMAYQKLVPIKWFPERAGDSKVKT